jgi:hypothetical protein
MSSFLQKLKEQTELQPKFVVKQEKVISSSIFVFDLNSDIDPNSVVENCKKYQLDAYRETATESVYAWRSDYYKIFENPMPEFVPLCEVVTSKINKIRNTPYSLVVDHFWFAIYNKGDSSKVHDHGWVDLACVYYASVPANSSPLIVPSIGKDITITPKTGMLVVMPGNCDHYVPKSEHEGERIIVAINMIKNQTCKPTANG